MPIIQPQGTSLTGSLTQTTSVSNSNHTHNIGDIGGLIGVLNSKSDVSHLHSITSIVGLSPALATKAASVHTHTISDISGLGTHMSTMTDSVATLTQNVSGLITLTGNHTTQISQILAQLGSNASSKPVIVSAPVITGTPSFGSTLSVSTGNWTNSPTGFFYVWNRKNTSGTVTQITGATASTYTLVAADAGMYISADVTSANSLGGNSLPSSSAFTTIVSKPPTITVNPSISGTFAILQTLSLVIGTWSDSPSFTYQWLRNGTAISGATGLSYATLSSDAGQKISVRVTGTISTGIATADSAEVTIAGVPVNQVLPTLSPSAINIGTPVSCTSGTWSFFPSFTYQWKINGVSIPNATSSAYTTISSDSTKSLTCTVTATNSAGVTSVDTAATVVGTATDGGTIYGSINRANYGFNANINDCLPFPVDNAFNTKINTYPISPYNAAFQENFGWTNLYPDFGGLMSPQPNGQTGILYGIQYHVVDGATQPMVSVTFTTEWGYNFGSESDSGPMPIPLDIQIEGGINGDDRHIIVLDKTNKKIYELYRVTKMANNTFMCGSAAIFDMTTNTWRPIGVANEWTSASASGMPIYPGLVRYEEAILGPGGIKHAIGFSMNYTRDAYIAPASHISSSNSEPFYLPMGARLRLKSSFVINAAWPTEVKAILTAMKDYGIICSNNGYDGFFTGAGDTRWDNATMNPIFAGITLDSFELVDTGTLYTAGHIAIPYPQVPTIINNPLISATPRVNSWSSVSNGDWTGEVYKHIYQWKLDGVAIQNAKYASYKPKIGDLGKQLSVTVTGIGPVGQLSFTTPSKTILAESFTYVKMPSPALSPPSSGQPSSNPVTYAMTGVRTFDIGPGKTYTTPDTFPWHTLVAGDVVNIYYSATPYNTLITIDAFGTETNPVIINGVTDANGNRPKFDVTAGCSNASVSAPIYYPSNRLSSDGWRRLGVFNLAIRGSAQWANYATGWYPEYITFQNFEVCGANTSTPNLITLPDGTTAPFFNGAAFYFLQSRNCTIENCKIYNNSFGVYTQARTGTSHININTTIRNSHFELNGIIDSYYEHNCYVQGMTPVVEGNYFGRLKSGANGSAYKSRTVGEVFRYNWCESHMRAVDLVHCEDWASVSTVQPDRPYTYVYGNVICNLSTASGYTWSPFHFGGDNTGEDSGSSYEPHLHSPLGYNKPTDPPNRYRERLFFYNNTYVTGGAGGMGSQYFDLSLMGGNLSPNDNGYVHDRTKVDAWNNAFYSGAGGANSWVQYAGTAHLHATNNVDGTVIDHPTTPASFVADAPGRLDIIKESGITYNSSGFANFANFDYTPTSTSTLLNRSIDDFQTTFSGSNAGGVQHYNVEFMPKIRSNGMVPRTVQGSAMDLGAFEYLDSTKPICSNRPTITGTIITTGNVLTCSTGTWNLPCTYTYQWKKNGVAISGETNNTYTTVVADDTASITCVVYATNAGNTAFIKSNLVYIGARTIMVNSDYSYGSAPGTGATSGGGGGGTTPTTAPPLQMVGPEIIGNTHVGQEVWAMPGIYRNGVASIEYTWMRSGTAIAGATSRRYILTSADIGSLLTVSVKIINTTGNITAVSPIFTVIATATGPIDPSADGVYTFDRPDGTVSTIYGFEGSPGNYKTNGEALVPVTGTGSYGGMLKVTTANKVYTRIDIVSKASRSGPLDAWLAQSNTGATGGVGIRYNGTTAAFIGSNVGEYTDIPSLISKSSDSFVAMTCIIDTATGLASASAEGQTFKHTNGTFTYTVSSPMNGFGFIPSGAPEADAAVYILRIK